MTDKLVISIGDFNGRDHLTVTKEKFSSQEVAEYTPDYQEEKRQLKIAPLQETISSCDKEIQELEMSILRPIRELAQGLDLPEKVAQELTKKQDRIAELRVIRAKAEADLDKLN